MHNQLPPSLWKNIISLQYASSLAIKVNTYAWLQELQTSQSAFLRSVAIFVKYRKVSTRTILPNFISNCRDSVVFAFWWPDIVKGERTSSILLANQGDSPGQPRRFPRGNQKGPCVQAHAFTTITVYSWWQFSELAYQSEIIFFQREGWKLVVHITI